MTNTNVLSKQEKYGETYLVVAMSRIPLNAGFVPARMNLRHIRGTMLSPRGDRPARNAGLPSIRHYGLRSGVREMAGREARRYQIVGTGVPAGAGFLVGQSRAERGIACRLMTGKMPVPPKKGLLRVCALAMASYTLLENYISEGESV